MRSASLPCIGTSPAALRSDAPKRTEIRDELQHCGADNEPTTLTCLTCGKTLARSAIRVGSILTNRYEIRKAPGQGGMGMVYRAYLGGAVGRIRINVRPGTAPVTTGATISPAASVGEVGLR